MKFMKNDLNISSVFAIAQEKIAPPNLPFSKGEDKEKTK
jgi:hypothetical protein